MWITFYYISTVDISKHDISVIYICFLYYIRHFFQILKKSHFHFMQYFFIVQKCHVFIEYDIFSGFSLWGIFYIFLVYFYSEILLMLSRHTFYFISPLPNKKSIKNHPKSFGKLFGNLPILLPKYSFQLPTKPPFHYQTTNNNPQTPHKSTVFSESNHFLIIMHSFSHSFLSKSNSHTKKILPFHIS